MKKSQITQEIEQNIKNKKKENNMKNITQSSKFKTFKDVALTLLTLALIAGIFYAGFTYGEKHGRGEEAYIQSQVKAQVLSATAEASKANLQSK